MRDDYSGLFVCLLPVYSLLKTLIQLNAHNVPANFFPVIIIILIRRPNLLESFLSPSKVDWFSKLAFEPLHIDEESLEVEGEGKAARISATDLDERTGGGSCVEGGVGGENEGHPPPNSGGVGRL